MPDLRSLSRIAMRGHPVLPLDSANGCAVRLEKLHRCPAFAGMTNVRYLSAGLIIPSLDVRLEPVGKLYPDPDTVRTGIVVNQAFAVTGKILKIPAQIFTITERKAPVDLKRPPVIGGAQIVAQQKADRVFVPLTAPGQFPIPQVVLDIRVVIGFFIFRNAVPGFEVEKQIVFFKQEIRIEPVSAS